MQNPQATLRIFGQTQTDPYIADRNRDCHILYNVFFRREIAVRRDRSVINPFKTDILPDISDGHKRIDDNRYFIYVAPFAL